MMQPPTEQCKSCPFRRGGLQLQPHYLAQIYQYLLEGENHLCHRSRQENRVCWGGRQWQLEVFHRLGYIAAPTNEALAARMRDSGVEPKEHISKQLN